VISVSRAAAPCVLAFALRAAAGASCLGANNALPSFRILGTLSTVTAAGWLCLA